MADSLKGDIAHGRSITSILAADCEKIPEPQLPLSRKIVPEIKPAVDSADSHLKIYQIPSPKIDDFKNVYGFLHEEEQAQYKDDFEKLLTDWQSVKDDYEQKAAKIITMADKLVDFEINQKLYSATLFIDLVCAIFVIAGIFTGIYSPAHWSVGAPFLGIGLGASLVMSAAALSTKIEETKKYKRETRRSTK